METEKTVYKRIASNSGTKHAPHFLQVLGMQILLGRKVFSISNRLISEVRLRSINPEDSYSEAKMLRGLSATGFEGMFTVSYEPFNQEVRFSIASESPEEYRAMISRLKASILASHPRAEFEFLEATPENVLWPIGGLPVSKQKNTLIVSRGGRISAVSFLSMRLDDNLLASLEDGLENAIRTSAESGCTFRFCVPIKSCRGFLHAIALWAKRREISLRYSRVYGELREKGLSHNKGFLVGSDLEKSSELRTLLSQHEALNSESICWTCSPLITVLRPLMKSVERASIGQEKYVEAIKASFSSSYGVGLEEVGWFGLDKVARSILTRKIVGSSKLHLSSNELELFVRLPRPITPGSSYMPKKTVEFSDFDILELKRDGISLGYYESTGGRLEVKIGIDDLPLHLAVFGVPGSGKTTLVKYLLKRYEKLGGTAMVFDRHGEYADELKDATCLGPESIRINLFKHEGDPGSHAKALSEVFAMAWPDEFGPLISYVFRRMYLKYARKADTPNLADFLDFLEKSTDSDDWAIIRSGRARDKLFSLLGRLSELLEGNMGKVFDTLEGGEDRFEELLSRSVVFNLVDFDTDRDANIFTWLILKKVYDYRRKRPNNGLPHITVCEEAHNIAPARFEGQETIVEKMLREMRKFWESVWLVDQRPLTVSRDILGLCGTIVCLRLQYSSDVEKVADTMHLNGEQALKLQELEQGEAIVLLPGMKTAIPVIIKT